MPTPLPADLKIRETRLPPTSPTQCLYPIHSELPVPEQRGACMWESYCGPHPTESEEAGPAGESGDVDPIDLGVRTGLQL